ncbi:MAG: phosphoglycolate phosphatase [Rhodocyclales bacterium GWA2_65_20]|nr:MAG: phosphoglycolate phosphatase [Rhodocyclales bacterium GWA2_65_20]
MIAAVLFDLDGTLADTARDLGGALNRLLAEEGRPAIPYEALRPHVSGGARALLRAGFGLTPADDAYMEFQRRFLAHYEAAICIDTVLFDGIAALLDELDVRAIPWGIVTNKSQRFTLAVVEGLGLRHRAACLVGGDSSPSPKPAASPLLLACGLVGTLPAETLYVGDDLRDVVAGKAAGLGTVAVSYGYLGDGPPIAEWGADRIVDTPGEILALLD